MRDIKRDDPIRESGWLLGFIKEVLAFIALSLAAMAASVWLAHWMGG